MRKIIFILILILFYINKISAGVVEVEKVESKTNIYEFENYSYNLSLKTEGKIIDCKYNILDGKNLLSNGEKICSKINFDYIKKYPNLIKKVKFNDKFKFTEKGTINVPFSGTFDFEIKNFKLLKKDLDFFEEYKKQEDKYLLVVEKFKNNIEECNMFSKDILKEIDEYKIVKVKFSLKENGKILDEDEITEINDIKKTFSKIGNIIKTNSNNYFSTDKGYNYYYDYMKRNKKNIDLDLKQLINSKCFITYDKKKRINKISIYISKEKISLNYSIESYSFKKNINSYNTKKYISIKNEIYNSRYKKYLPKIDKLILKTNLEKLKKINLRLEKIDLKNKKYEKFRVLIEYLKEKIKVEISERKKIFKINRNIESNEIHITKDSYGDYPAILLNLERGKIIQVNENFKDIDSPIDADLWIEPNDPEISGLKGLFEGRVHKGKDTKISIFNKKYEDISINSITELNFGERLKRDTIVQGNIFIVKDSKNNYYKIKITYFNKEKNEMSLRYSILK